jgi:CRISPR-associated endonuclease/helicase Cas3
MLLSHPEEKNAPEKPLKEHLRNVGEISRRQIQKMRLNLTIISQDKLAELSYLIGIFHDFGKSSTYFQQYIRGQRNGDALTQHSFISALVAYHMIRQKGFDPVWPVIAYLLIKRHHGNLETLREDEQDNLNIAGKQLENILAHHVEEIKTLYSGIFDLAIMEQLEVLEIESFGDEIEEFEDFFDVFGDNCPEEKQRIELFFVVNLLFSVLIDNDKKDAARLDMEYFEGNLNEPINDIFAYIEDCRRKDPKKFDPASQIMELSRKNISIPSPRPPELEKLLDVWPLPTNSKNSSPKTKGGSSTACPIPRLSIKTTTNSKRLSDLPKRTNTMKNRNAIC